MGEGDGGGRGGLKVVGGVCVGYVLMWSGGGENGVV